MTKTRKWAAVAGVGMAVLVLVALALPVAAANTETASVQHRGGPMGGGVNDTYLAQALGITADELQTARQTAYENGIDQALAEGLITQAQADALKERGGNLGRFGGFELHGFLGLAGEDTAIDPEALLASALAITTDDLQAARVEAQDLALAAAVEDGRLTQEQVDQMKADRALKTYLDEQGFQTQAQALYESLVQQAVQDGVITQEQADAILSRSAGFGRFGGMRGFDGMRGMDGFRGHGGMRGPAAPSVAPDDNGTSTRFQQSGVLLGSVSL